MRDDRHFNGRRQVCQSHSSARLPDSRLDLAERTFQRRFQLADHVVVKGARPENGLLHVDVVRELPESIVDVSNFINPRTLRLIFAQAMLTNDGIIQSMQSKDPNSLHIGSISVRDQLVRLSYCSE